MRLKELLRENRENIKRDIERENISSSGWVKIFLLQKNTRGRKGWV